MVRSRETSPKPGGFRAISDRPYGMVRKWGALQNRYRARRQQWTISTGLGQIAA